MAETYGYIAHRIPIKTPNPPNSKPLLVIKDLINLEKIFLTEINLFRLLPSFLKSSAYKVVFLLNFDNNSEMSFDR